MLQTGRQREAVLLAVDQSAMLSAVHPSSLSKEPQL